MYNNDIQLEAFYNYVKTEIESVDVTLIKPKIGHIIERANERDIDSSVIAKVIIKGIKENYDTLNFYVKTMKHSVTLVYRGCAIILKVCRGYKDGKLLVFLRTCYPYDAVKRTIHEFEVVL